MRKREQLIKVDLPELLAFEILGPPPPERVTDFAPTSARLAVKAPSGMVARAIQNQHTFSCLTEARCEPFLFEETSYEFITEILDKGSQQKQFSILSRGRQIPYPSRRVGRSNVYTCQVNFGSQIGFVDLQFCLDDHPILGLGLEVFPSKLDYRQDLWQIRADLEHEVRDLAFSIGRITYHRTRRRRDVRAREVEWLENIRQLFGELEKAFNRIQIAPRYSVYVDERIQKANRPSRAGASVRRFIRSHLSDCVPTTRGHFRAHGREWRIRLLPSERKRLTYDTPENRYVKWALITLQRLVRKSLERFRSQRFKPTSNLQQWISLLQKYEQRLKLKSDALFLKECGEDLLMPPQSLALHMAPGYREFFTCFLDLLSGLKVSGGPFELSEKDLAILYEMWCFIKLGNILNRRFAIEAVPDWLKVGRNGIGVAIQKGRSSALSLTSTKGETIRLLYNPVEKTPTGTRYPDNFLEIRKMGSSAGFHYIFDAKYRLCDDPDYIRTHGAPGPPEDAINKMHAYRDQIVYDKYKPIGQHVRDSFLWDQGNRRYVQKSIAAFVLFPYAGEDVTQNTFFQSIEKVGIGGVPFLPGRTKEVEHLLEQLVDASSESEEDRAVGLYSADERKRIVWSHQYGLVGIVRHPQQLDYIMRHRIYHMPYVRIRGARLRADFVLLFQSKTKFGVDAGIHLWAKIRSFQVGPRAEISPVPTWPGRSDDLYAWFRLGEVQRLSKPLTPPEKGHPAYFRITTRLALEEAKTIEELSLIREPERRFYHELLRAGFYVQVREDIKTKRPTYDISDLTIIFRISLESRGTVRVYFDPKQAAFLSGTQRLFGFEDLMFDAGRCINIVRELCTGKA